MFYSNFGQHYQTEELFFQKSTSFIK